MNRTITYAQNREDIILNGFFPMEESGFYVDVGANSPDIDSVTKLFYLKGWHGINIEPIRSHFEQLKKQRPKDINLNIGASNMEGTLSLREYRATGLSTFSDSMKDTYDKDENVFAREYVDYKVKTKTLAQIFEQHSVTSISFMKVDVEGFEYEVLEGNDWRRFRPEIICIEANHVEKDWRRFLAENNYQLVFFDGLNEYYVDRAKSARAERFSYVESVIFKEPIVSYLLIPELEDYDRTLIRNHELENEVAIKNQYIAHLDGVLTDITPLRRHLKRQVKERLKRVHRKIIKRLSSEQKYRPSTISIESNDLLPDAQKMDKANFETYNTAAKPTIGLSFYFALCRLAVRSINKLLGLRKR